VTPYVHTTGWPLHTYDELSEEGQDAGAIRGLVEQLVARDAGSVVVCSHRTVIPRLLEALGLPAPELEPAEMVVVHHRKGGVVATERVRA
jgi:8-oxo-dGTP diphosphatase